MAYKQNTPNRTFCGHCCASRDSDQPDGHIHEQIDVRCKHAINAHNPTTNNIGSSNDGGNFVPVCNTFRPLHILAFSSTGPLLAIAL